MTVPDESAARVRNAFLDARFERSLREAPNPLISNKAVKSGVFEVQDIKDLAKHKNSLMK